MTTGSDPALPASLLVVAAVVVMARPRVRWRGLRIPAVEQRGQRCLAGTRWRGMAYALAITGGGVAGVIAGSVVAGGAAATYAVLVVRDVRRRRRLRNDENERRVAEEIVVGLAADLRAGLAPADALASAAGTGRSRMTHLADVARVAQTGGDVAAALRRDSSRSTRAVWLAVSVAWRVAEITGAPLADVFDRLDAELAAQRAQRLRLDAQAAGAGVTAQLLAVLPIVGLAVGAAVGAQPVRTLLHSTLGAVCVGTGLAMQVAGVLWMERIIGRGGAFGAT